MCRLKTARLNDIYMAASWIYVPTSTWHLIKIFRINILRPETVPRGPIVTIKLLNTRKLERYDPLPVQGGKFNLTLKLKYSARKNKTKTNTCRCCLRCSNDIKLSSNFSGETSRLSETKMIILKALRDLSDPTTASDSCSVLSERGSGFIVNLCRRCFRINPHSSLSHK